MPASKITQLAYTGILASGDLLTFVDVSDTTMSASGTNKQVNFGDFLGNIPYAQSGDNISQFINDSGYINAESDTLNSVLSRGNASTNSISLSGTIHASTGIFNTIDLALTTEANRPPYQEGRMFYDTDTKALTVYNEESEVLQQLGQETYLKARNQTGSTIANGKAVYIDGSQGTHPTIALASKTGQFTSRAVGLATHDIENNSFGYVTVYGVVNNLDTSSFAEGIEVHLQESGNFGTGIPQAPDYRISLGYVIRSHPTIGSIFVLPEKSRLGGGQLQTDPPVSRSGIVFFNYADGIAGTLSSDSNFVYDSGNQRVHLGSGGLRFTDGTIQTTRGVPSGDNVSVFNNDAGYLTSVGNVQPSSILLTNLVSSSGDGFVVQNGSSFVRGGLVAGTGVSISSNSGQNPIIHIGQEVSPTGKPRFEALAIGNNNNPAYGFFTNPMGTLSGSVQIGIFATPYFSTSATSIGASITAKPQLSSGSFTCAQTVGLLCDDPSTLQGGAAITELVGVRIVNQTKGSTNIGLKSEVSSSTNKWNIYANGTAQSYFAHDVHIGGTNKVTAGGGKCLVFSDTTDPTLGSSVDNALYGTSNGIFIRKGASSPVNILNPRTKMRVDIYPSRFVTDVTNGPDITTSQYRTYLDYDDTVAETAYSDPYQWTATGIVDAHIYYTMAGTNTGNVVWNVKVEAISSGDSFNLLSNSSFDSSNSGVHSVPSSSGYIGLHKIGLINRDNASMEDYFRISLTREANNGSDTATGDAKFLLITLVER